LSTPTPFTTCWQAAVTSTAGSSERVAARLLNSITGSADLVNSGAGNDTAIHFILTDIISDYLATLDAIGKTQTYICAEWDLLVETAEKIRRVAEEEGITLADCYRQTVNKFTQSTRDDQPVAESVRSIVVCALAWLPGNNKQPPNKEG